MKLKTEVSRKFEHYRKEKARAKMVISRMGKAPRVVVQESLRVKPINIGLMRRNLKEAFEGVNDTVVDLRSMTAYFKTSLKNE